LSGPPSKAPGFAGGYLQRKGGYPELLTLRGQARLEAGDAKAVYDDLAQANRIAPDNPLMQQVFAARDVDAGDFDAALRSLDARLHADSSDAQASFQRGRVWLYKSEPQRARADVARAESNAATLYPALWRFLAEARLGIDGAPTLRKQLAVTPEKWPAPVARIFLGEILIDVNLR
jgi:lipoprotein NlpI